MAPWAGKLGEWYTKLYATRGPTPRRIAVRLGGSPGGAIEHSIVTSLKRCGHEVVDAKDKPDLIMANWWKDAMGKLALPTAVPIVHWWIGSDTHHTTPHSRDARYNWCVSPWLARLLKQRVGVSARVIPIVPAFDPCLLRRSDTRNVLVYCPARREHKYCWDEMLEIARRCPSLEFRVLGKGGAPELDNMVHLPKIDYVDMPSVYADTRLLLRLAPSDGMSLSVLEALGFGRHVVWNWWAPGATHVSNMKEALEAIRRLIAAAPYAGGVASALEVRAQADHSMCAAIEEAIS